MENYNSKFRRSLRKLPGFNSLRKVYRWWISGENWSRVVMHRETKALIDNISPADLTVLEISGEKWKEYQFKKYTTVHYPEFNICESKLNEKFDLIIAEQVFEHLLWPYRAGRNISDMFLPGGHFLITTPFLMGIHEVPTDCSRWTETGLKHFLAECGFAIDDIKTGSWGNRSCIRASLSGFPVYRKLIHSLKNEPDFPIVVWALAKKGTR